MLPDLLYKLTLNHVISLINKNKCQLDITNDEENRTQRRFIHPISTPPT